MLIDVNSNDGKLSDSQESKMNLEYSVTKSREIKKLDDIKE